MNAPGWSSSNRHIPHVFGKDNAAHVSEVDYIIEGDDQPSAELPNPGPSEIDRTVARRIAAEVEEGACLQIGIGGMPNAVCALLMDNGVKDLGIHTEWCPPEPEFAAIPLIAADLNA